MRGRTVFLDSLRAHGVRRIFGNPGTTESPLLDALRDRPDLQYVAALHEGIAVTAASYYAQASGEPVVANVHVAPGLGNGLGSLYGALRAGSPLVLTAGQQDTRMRLREPMLQHDLVAMAAPLCKWSAQVEHADEMGALMARAFKIACEPPQGPVFVALPINVMEQETDNAAFGGGRLYANPPPDPAGIADVAGRLLRSANPAILAGEAVARAGAVGALVRLAEQTGASVYHDGLRLQLSFPNRHPANMGALPFEAGAIRAMLADHDLILMLGGPFFEEVWFDAVRAIPETVPIAQIAPNHPVLARNFELAAGVVGDPAAALEALAGVVADMASAQFEAAAAQRRATLEQRHAERRAQGEAALRSRWDALPMLPGRALLEVAAALPEDVIVVDESITAGRDVQFAFEFAAAGDYFGQRGGGIGQGIAGALGVKIANPERPVLCISGDGSAMYHIQSLWTAANLGLDIVFVILANREYRVLKHNLDIYRRRFDAASNNPYPFMDFTPAMDFAALASGLGVAGVRISDPAALQAAVQRAFAAGGPHLIEVAVSGKES